MELNKNTKLAILGVLIIFGTYLVTQELTGTKGVYPPIEQNDDTDQTNVIGVKYLILWEFDVEKLDEVMDVNMAFLAAQEEDPDKFYTYVFPPHYIGNGKGFSVVMISDPVQIMNSQILLEPIFKMEFVPCSDIVEHLTARYMMEQ